MRRFLLLCLAFVLPVAALALDYTDHTSRYTDAPFSKPEATAISLLTNLGAVSGNPDGTFAPNRAINRAEFLKIAFLSMPSVAVTSSDAASCFPDVRSSDWFSSFVCLAKRRGTVQGYTDGKFHPERIVSYAEALKMTAELYRGGVDPAPWEKRCAKADALSNCLVYEDITYAANTPWYTRYVDWARGQGLLLPISLSYDAPLTRGQMARLVASFVADHAGELEEYRAQEQGRSLSSGASSSSRTSSLSSSASSISSSMSSSLPSSSSSSSSVTSSSSSRVSYIPSLPVRSRFLVLGTWSEPIASATFRPDLEAVVIRIIQVKLKTKIVSIDRLQVMDRDGVVVGDLYLDPYDHNDLTWKGSFNSSGAYQIPKNDERVLVLRAHIKAGKDGGKTEQLVQVDTFTLSVVGLSSGDTYNSASETFVYPKHQTAMGRIMSVQSVLPAQGILPIGQHQLIASFTITGSGTAESAMRVESLMFQVSKSSSIAISNWELRAVQGDERAPCSVSEGVVDCLALSQEVGSLQGSRTYELLGDVAVDQGAQNPYLQVTLGNPGTVGENGGIRWTDGSGHFTWTELNNPIATGTKWQG